MDMFFQQQMVDVLLSLLAASTHPHPRTLFVLRTAARGARGTAPVTSQALGWWFSEN